MTKIFINPGHSLNCKPDAGCVYNGIKEAEICAEIAEILKNKLVGTGIEVELYQQCNELNTVLTSNQQLNKVVKVANASKADLFLSIHMNGFTSSTAKGTETWYAKGSQKGEYFAELVNTQLTQPFANYTFTNRGAKVDERGLLVLRSTIMPAVLTEIGFISNPDEAKFIKVNKTNIAERLYNAICTYFGIVPKKQNEKLEIRMELVYGDKYNLYINDVLKLSENKFSTCVDYLNKNYGV